MTTQEKAELAATLQRIAREAIAEMRTIRASGKRLATLIRSLVTASDFGADVPLGTIDALNLEIDGLAMDLAAAFGREQA